MRYFEDSSADSPIPLAVRPGMRTSEVTFQSERYWVAKDPHQQDVHHFNEQEYAILQWLDGRTSFQAIKERFNHRFTPQRINFTELANVLRGFIQKSVVIPTNGSVGSHLLETGEEKRRKQLVQRLKSITAIKWKGWNPDRFLGLTYPLVGWFFSLPVVIANGALLLFSLAWMLIHYEEFFARLPKLWSFLEPENWVSLGLTVVIAKLLHELGHAFVNRRFGGRCQEIGVMIFFFMPTLYCNASDSWLLPSKWKRIAIGLGGVYVETFLFSLASFGWWFSLPGDWNTFCMNMMLVCSISAILTNGNPLLRYDGYFVLADWLEIPNLSQKANAEIRRQFLNKGLGIESEVDLWTSRYNKRIYL
ncbi:MAG: hemolysin D, partial [Planctomycetota bacterium]